MQDRLAYFISLAKEGRASQVDFLISHLDEHVNLGTTKVVDYTLGLVRNPEGVERIEYYLFNGTQIQRNYCTLYFSRNRRWDLVKRAYDLGLIDYIQAYAR